MRVNIKRPSPTRTHEGAPAIKPKHPIDQLRRSVMACFLWEDQFYEDGQTIADRIEALVAECDTFDVALLASEARSEMNLRHTPLWLMACLARHNMSPLSYQFERVIQRPDELAEIIALFWKDGKRPIPAQMKLGLGNAFKKFDEYALAKYDRKGDIRLRDVLRLVHPKPDNDEQSDLFKRLIAGELKTPDTWETNLSAGADKCDTFTRLLKEEKLGYLALLRNLRNMVEAGVDRDLINQAIVARKGARRVLPFRYVAAARHAPSLEPAIDVALLSSLHNQPKFAGTTVVLVDVSGSMSWELSSKSDLNRIDAAAALGSVVTGEQVRVFTFSNNMVEVPHRLGMAGVDAIKNSQPHGSTYLGQAVQTINMHISYDRLIVITDEQSHDPVPPPTGRGYMINVASQKNGIGYGDWVRITGFSEAILRYIMALEDEKPVG